jgi:KaiC/GvpD/RAD55 family RecA-like ATPase
VNDAQIIAACLQSRKAYERVAPHIGDKDLSPQGNFWWKYVVAWYERDKDAQAVDRGIMGAEGARDLALAKHKETLTGYYKEIPVVPSAYNVAHEVLALKRRNKELEYAAAIASADDLNKRAKLHKELGELMAASDLVNAKPVTLCNDNEQMFELLKPGNRIFLAPQKLADRCNGGAIPGDHIVIFGRPEAGKTLFTLNMAAGFLRRGRKVLYFGNEENVYKTRQRIVSNLAGMTSAHVLREPTLAIERAKAKGLDHLLAAHGEPGNIAQLEDLLGEHAPEVLVVDQIRNLEHSDAGKDGSLTRKLEGLAVEVRNLAARHSAVAVSVTQAGDKTEKHGQEPPIWLSMSDVDSSRTGLPAQADLIVGVGVSHDLADKGQRAISLPKNKLGMTHEGFMVDVDLQRSTVK